jgi:hypothetical protein
MRTPMPSPTGSNREQLFLPGSFPRPAGAAYDEAPEAPASRRAVLKRRARRYFEEAWRIFCEATGLELEDDPAEDESVTEPQHRAIEAAAHTEPEIEYGMGPATEDELPEYRAPGSPGIPRNDIARRHSGAMDELRRITQHIVVEREPKPRQPQRMSESARRRLEAMVPGIAGIKTGPI